MVAKKRVFVAGHNGMVGSAICRQLRHDENVELIVAAKTELDLTSQADVNVFFSRHQFDQIYLAAAKVGGIHANNTYPAEFIYSNIAIQTNVIEAAHCYNVDQLLFLGSSCIYPRAARQPMKEEELLAGPLEPTNEAYSIAKIAGIKMCDAYFRQYDRDYRSVMPTNLYGPGDNYHPENSHVIPGLIRRFHEAKVTGSPNVSIWGTGRPKREFLYVDDMASACIFVMNLPRKEFEAKVDKEFRHINVGFGSDVSIADLAEQISLVVGYQGRLEFDVSRPDGVSRKFLDTSRLNNLGWKPEVSLSVGLKQAYYDFCHNEHIRR